MAGDAALLELNGVGKNYTSAEGGSSLAILRDLHLRLLPGEVRCIVGPSGSGKTTLLNLLGSLDRPDSGQILFKGRDISRLDDTELARVRNREIGFVFQFHYLLPHLSVLENVLVPTLASEDPAARAAAPDRARRLLDRVGLSPRLDHRPGQLSGGERQRAAVVRALINQPGLLLADEPTGALDQRSARELGRLLADLNREEHVALVVVTHSLDLAHELGPTLELLDGRLQPVPAPSNSSPRSA